MFACYFLIGFLRNWTIKKLQPFRTSQVVTHLHGRDGDTTNISEDESDQAVDVYQGKEAFKE